MFQSLFSRQNFSFGSGDGGGFYKYVHVIHISQLVAEERSWGEDYQLLKLLKNKNNNQLNTHDTPCSVVLGRAAAEEEAESKNEANKRKFFWKRSLDKKILFILFFAELFGHFLDSLHLFQTNSSIRNTWDFIFER